VTLIMCIYSGLLPAYRWSVSK